MYLLQCKTNFFIHRSFKREIYCKLKNTYLVQPPLISKKFFLIRLDSPTFLYTLGLVCVFRIDQILWWKAKSKLLLIYWLLSWDHVHNVQYTNKPSATMIFGTRSKYIKKQLLVSFSVVVFNMMKVLVISFLTNYLLELMYSKRLLLPVLLFIQGNFINQSLFRRAVF